MRTVLLKRNHGTDNRNQGAGNPNQGPGKRSKGMEKSNFDLSLFYQVETARLCACVLLASTPLVCRARAWKRSVGNRWERVTNRKMGTPRPHLHRDWAHPSRTCDGIGLAPATSAPGPAGLTPRWSVGSLTAWARAMLCCAACGAHVAWCRADRDAHAHVARCPFLVVRCTVSVARCPLQGLIDQGATHVSTSDLPELERLMAE